MTRTPHNGLGVARVLHVLPDLLIGRDQRVVLAYLRHVDRNRFDVRVAFISSAGELGSEFEAVGTNPIYLQGERGHGLRGYLGFARRVRREQIDLLHVHGGVTQRYGQFAALATGVPVIAHLDSAWIANDVSPKRAWVADRGFAWIECRTIAHYIACTETARDVYAPNVRAPITVIDNGVMLPSEKLRTPEARMRMRSSLGLDADAQVILNVGVLEPRKRVDTLISMMSPLSRDHPNAVLVVAGEGRERARLEAQVAEAGLRDRVFFLGSRPEVASLTAAANVFVFAAERAGLPVAVLEAMAAGTPVVASRLPALEELVEDGVDGVLTDIGDADGFAAAVGRLLDDQEAARDIGDAGRRLVFRRFDAADMARSFEAVYRQLLDR